MKPDAQLRLDYLAQTRELLWPPNVGAPTEATGDSPGRGIRVMRILPNASQPRLFAPAAPRRSGASAVLRYVAQQPLLSRARGAAVAAAVGVGLHERNTPGEFIDIDRGASIDEHLGDVLGEPVSSSLALTPNRANRKPVLQVFDARGRTLAFAKVAVSDLSTTLIEAEAAALSEVSAHDTPHLRIPEVLDCRAWRGMPVLVTSVLPAFSTGRRRADLFNHAMLEISRIRGRDAPRDADAYLSALSARADAAVPVVDPGVLTMWRERFEPAAWAARTLELPVATWHGDWSPWNCVAARGVIAAWDWERFSGAGLGGFDRLHYTLHREAIGRRRGFAAAARQLLARAPEQLAPWSLSAERSRAVAAMYLLDIALRYAADAQRTARGAGAIDVWALPALAAAEASHR